jgi:hypothetical protein
LGRFLKLIQLNGGLVCVVGLGVAPALRRRASALRINRLGANGGAGILYERHALTKPK